MGLTWKSRIELAAADGSMESANAFRRFILLLVEARCSLKIRFNFPLTWKTIGLKSDLDIKVPDFATLMRGGKTVFDLPPEEQLRGGDFVERMRLLHERFPRDRVRWSAWMVAHSIEFVRESALAPGRRQELCAKLQAQGTPIWNTKFKHFNVQATTGARPGYSPRVFLSGRTKAEVGTDMIKLLPHIGRFAVSHALLLLSRTSARSLEQHKVQAVHDSAFFGNGTDWALLLLASSRLKFVPSAMPVPALEQLLLQERVQFRHVARSMVASGDLERIPYFVRQQRDDHGSNAAWLALPETLADVLCEARQAVSLLVHSRGLKRPLRTCYQERSPLRVRRRIRGKGRHHQQLQPKRPKRDAEADKVARVTPATAARYVSSYLPDGTPRTCEKCVGTSTTYQWVGGRSTPRYKWHGATAQRLCQRCYMDAHKQAAAEEACVRVVT